MSITHWRFLECSWLEVLQILAFPIPDFTVSGFFHFGFTDSGFSHSEFYRFPFFHSGFYRIRAIRLFSFRVLLIPAFRIPGFLVPHFIPHSIPRFPIPCFTDSHISAVAYYWISAFEINYYYLINYNFCIFWANQWKCQFPKEAPRMHQ